MFAFDRRRIAILLVAGDKRGVQQARFYKKLVAIAEDQVEKAGGHMTTAARRTLAEVIASLPADEQEAIEAQAKQLIAKEMTLRDLRKAMGKTQAQIAKRTGKPQAAISRIEKQSDVLLSTLNEIVGALGGRVRIMAELPGREPVFLTGFADVEPVPLD